MGKLKLLFLFATAVTAAVAAAGTRTPDENGLVPFMWWDCAGNFFGEHSLGANDSNDYINGNVKNNWTALARSRKGAQGAVRVDKLSQSALGAPWFRVGDSIKVGRSWAVSFTARSSYHETTGYKTALLGLGHKNNPTNFVLGVKHDGTPTLYMMPYGNTPEEIAAATGVDVRARFHHYLITYVYASSETGGTLALYVDGVKAGEQAGYFSHGGNTECNFGRANSNSSQFYNAYDCQSTGRGLEVADFRVYSGVVLTEEQIAQMAAANAPWPTVGIAAQPQVYLNLNGAYNDGTYKGTCGIQNWYVLPESWVATDEGERQAFCFMGEHAGFRAGTGALSDSARSWTVLVRGCFGKEENNVALFGLGHENNSNSVVVASAGAGQLKLSRTGDTTPSKNSHEDLASGTAAKLTTQLHTFALVNNHPNATLSLYVDGELVCSSTDYPYAVAGNEFCLGRGNSTGNGGFTTAFGTVIDDFRIYGSVLTAEEIGGYAEEYAVCPVDPTIALQLPTLAHKFVGSVAQGDFWGSRTSQLNTYNGFDGPETNFLWSADRSDAAVMLQENSVCHVKGSFGQSFYDSKDEWTLSMTVRSVDTTNAALVIVGYANDTTTNVWGLVSAGKDKLEYRQWKFGNSSTVIARCAFAVPRASRIFHTITLVHPLDSTGTDESLSIYVDGECVAKGNYYLDRGSPCNDITFGGMDGKLMPWKTDQTALDGVVRGIGVALDEFRIYDMALSAEQVEKLVTVVAKPWTACRVVAAGETLDATGEGGLAFTDTVIDFAAGSALAVQVSETAVNGLALASNYDQPLLILPTDGKVTLLFTHLGALATLPQNFTVIAGAKLTAADRYRFKATIDSTSYRVKLSVAENGDLVAALVGRGGCIAVR
ncbi:MAG: LamG-like jellyroll fold domain-containing protein [Kiritimatiellia bacterium]